jgi:hypothetical protein
VVYYGLCLAKEENPIKCCIKSGNGSSYFSQGKDLVQIPSPDNLITTADKNITFIVSLSYCFDQKGNPYNNSEVTPLLA